MKKAKRNVKAMKLVKKTVVFALVQLLIVVFFLRFISESKLIVLEDTTPITVTVDDIKYERVISEYRFSIYSDSIEYRFHNQGVFARYSNRELYETIEIGDEISIVYVERYDLTGKYKSVIDARTEMIVYRSIEEYNELREPAFIAAIVISSIIELVFILVFIVWIMFNREGMKLFLSKNKSKE